MFRLDDKVVLLFGGYGYLGQQFSQAILDFGATLYSCDINIDDSQIVKAIITLAKGLDLKLVAEGVEKKEQLDFLKDAGVDYIQGNYYSKALTVKEILNYFYKRPPFSLDKSDPVVIPYSKR